MKPEFSRQISEKCTNIKFLKKSVKWKPSCSMRTDRQTDGQTDERRDMTKLRVDFRNSSNTPNKCSGPRSMIHLSVWPGWLKCPPAPIQTKAGLLRQMNMGHWWNYIWQGKPEKVGEQLVSMPPSQPQLSHAKQRERNKASAMRRQRITASPTRRGNDCRQWSFIFSVIFHMGLRTWGIRRTRAATSLSRMYCGHSSWRQQAAT